MDTSQRYFGTDGVRGVANLELTCDMAYTLGAASVAQLGKRLVIGRDTRISGDMLEAALVAGITSQGGTALLAGIIPTPAVALLTRELKADGGIVISASHNPPEYNGIKFFDAQGYKLAPQQEDRLEASLHHSLKARLHQPHTQDARVTGTDIGRAVPVPDATERYLHHAVDLLARAGISLTGLTIAVDCGNGASLVSTPEALRRLGAHVVVINDEGDGAAINVNSGSTNLTPLRALVAQSRADVGLAHDGDADRVIAVSASGAEIDGDYIEAICALDRKATSGLPGNTVVSTVMCNIGFIQSMEAAGIQVIQTPVGDANVLAALREGGYALGGEQSGHMIFLEHNSTGDGLVTALMLLAALKRSGKTLDALAAAAMCKYPQCLINVPVARREALEGNEAVRTAIAQAEADLARLGGGRVLVRASGTEPLVRVMVEAISTQTAEEVAGSLAQTVIAELA